MKKHKCWVDVCEIHDNLLKIWGWVYIIKANSRNSKLKIMLKSRKKEYIFGTDLRSRDDIQKTFGSECNNYSFSGIDFSVSLDGIENGDYSVYILLKNEMRRYRIKIKRNLKIECSC